MDKKCICRIFCIFFILTSILIIILSIVELIEFKWVIIGFFVIIDSIAIVLICIFTIYPCIDRTPESNEPLLESQV